MWVSTRPAWQYDGKTATAQHDEGDEVIEVAETVSHADRELDLVVH